MKRLGKDEARDTARAVLARERPGRRYGLGCLKHREGPMASQVFCAATPGERLTFKVWAPAFAERAAAQAIRQREVAAAMGSGPHRAPAEAFFDAEALCLGMDYVDGPTLAELWPGLTSSERCAHIEQAARWIAAFHATSLRPHPFRPRGQVSWLHRLLDWHEEGRRDIPDIAAFRRETAALETMAEDIRGRPGIRAVTHRDMHLGNLIAAEDALWGIDFENPKEDEPYRDLVWLLVDAMARAPGETPMTGLAAAIARGYGDDTTDPGVRRFLQRLFAMGVWAATPANPSLRQAARHAAAREIVSWSGPLFET